MHLTYLTAFLTWFSHALYSQTLFSEVFPTFHNPARSKLADMDILVVRVMRATKGVAKFGPDGAFEVSSQTSLAELLDKEFQIRKATIFPMVSYRVE